MKEVRHCKKENVKVGEKVKDINGRLLANVQKIEKRRKKYFIVLLEDDDGEANVSMVGFGGVHRACKEQRNITVDKLMNPIARIKNRTRLL